MEICLADRRQSGTAKAGSFRAGAFRAGFSRLGGAEDDEGLDAQKAFIRKRGADGIPEAEICREAGISLATCFKWKKKNDGLQPTEMNRPKQLEDENANMRKLVAELSFARRTAPERTLPTSASSPFETRQIWAPVLAAPFPNVTLPLHPRAVIQLFHD